MLQYALILIQGDFMQCRRYMRYMKNIIKMPSRVKAYIRDTRQIASFSHLGTNGGSYRQT